MVVLFPWKLHRKIDKIERTVDQIKSEVNDLKQDDLLMELVRDEQKDMDRRIRILEDQAGVMDPGGIEDDDR